MQEIRSDIWLFGSLVMATISDGWLSWLWIGVAISHVIDLIKLRWKQCGG